jgi:hypothetical protein
MVLIYPLKFLFPGPQVGPDGCSILVVTCTAPPGGTDFMQFNFNQGGPIQPTGNPVIATLNCVNGVFFIYCLFLISF